MPLFIRLTASLSIWVYPTDHVPPHFHLIGSDTDAMIELRDLRGMRGSYRRKDLRAALDWALEHREEFGLAWRQQHVEP